MGLVIDKLSGQIFLFDTSGGGGGTGYTGAYPEVETFADLPLPISAATQIRVVRTSTGAYLINRKEAGLYYSNGATWRRLGDIPSFFDDDNFEIYDGDDNTKRVKFQASNITSNTIRSVTFQDSDGTIAYLANVNLKLDKTTFNTYTGTTAPAFYLSKTAFNTYSGITKSDIESRLVKALFDVYSANTESLINGKVSKTGDTLTGQLLFSTDGTIDGAYGRIRKNPDYAAFEVDGREGLFLNSPFLVNGHYSGYTGAFLTIGQGGALTLTTLYSGATSWQDTKVGSTPIVANTPVPIGLSVSTDFNVNTGSVEWSSDFFNPSNQEANVLLKLLINGVPNGNGIPYVVTKNSTNKLFGSIPLFTTILSGDTLDIQVTSNKNGTVTNSILKVISNTNSISTTIPWGNITGNILLQTDLQNQFATKLNISDFTGFTATTGLQGVTEIGAITTIESTFNGGLVTNRIRPTGDTVNGIQIRKADGLTTLINLDTISGLTGFGTDVPRGLIHAYGRDNSEGSAINTQTNALIIDGDNDVDKDVAWFDNGVPKWLAEIYRGEDAEFWYLYNVEADNPPLTVVRSGEVGVNTPSNILGYHAAQKIGDGLNDLVTSGVYTENYNTVYQVKIASITGATDHYVWRKSIDEGSSYTLYSPVSAVTTTPVLLENGVEISFINLTGHTVGDVFQFIAFTQLPQATLSVSAFPVHEIVVTDNYTATTVEYKNQTGTLNGGLDLPSIPIFPTGSTDGAILFGFTIPAHGVSISLTKGGFGLSLVAEYYNPILSGWTAINTTNNHLVDNTNNLTKSGRIIWNPYTFINWSLAPIFPGIYSDHDELYWIRLRTVSPPVTSPEVVNISVGSDKVLSVYSISQDARPKLFVDSLGRTNIGGGSITGKNVLQINSNRFNTPTVTASDSLVEIDSEDSSAIDLKIKLASNDNKAPGLTFFKGRGTLSGTTGIISGDTLFRIDGRGSVGVFGRYLSQISSTYIGDGISRIGDIRISTANGSEPVERVRINHNGTGFGVSPTAYIDIQSGTTTHAQARFRNGSLVSTPIIGGFEFSNDHWFGTPADGIRKTFAFLENPSFVGAVNLPTGTTLNGVNLIDRISISGGTNNPNLVKTTNFNSYTAVTDTRIDNIEDDIIYISAITDTKLDITDFNTYTGSTIPWSRVSKVGSNLNELQTRNAVDVNNTITEWSSTNVSDVLEKITDYMEDTQGSGRIFPENVLGGRFTTLLIVSAGTGYINYSGLHKIVTWSGTTFSTTGLTVQSLYYVYIDNSGVAHISLSAPSTIENIILGTFYNAINVIGSINQSGCMIKSTYNRVSDFTSRIGLFIYDNGGKVNVYSGNSLGIYSAPMKIQNGFLSIQNTELSTANANTAAYLNYYNNSDLSWVVNYYFNYGNHGLLPTDRWNDITKTAAHQLTGYTVNFTAGSKTVTSSSDLTSLITTNDFICKVSDTRRWMNPVSAITWNGSQTIIKLESNYSGTTGAGVAMVDSSLPRMGTKFAKHLVFRTPDNTMALVLAQTRYDNYNDAKNGVLPLIPNPLETLNLKMAYIVTSTGTTDLTGNIYDIRPLPFTFREGGQAGVGSAITIHGQLSGLGADDHLQYLRTDGGRLSTGIQRYLTHPTFTTDVDIVDKKYVDDADALKLNSNLFTGYTATTAPSTYLSISNFNIYSGATLSNINSRLLKTTFNTFTGSTAPSTYLSISNFNSYSAATLTNINTRLLRSVFNGYTGTTAPSTYLTISNFNGYSGTTIPANYYNKTQINAYSAHTDSIKANLLSPVFSGTPTAPTALANSNTLQIANTAFVVGQASNLNPLINGAVAIGSSLKYSREDHVHPTDTTRLAVTIFNGYTGTTAPATYALKSVFNSYTGSTVASASNGLRQNGTNVRLGGSLTGTTNIGLGTFNLVFTGSTGTLRYGSDLSASYNVRSLVDRGYVTGITSTLLSITAFNTYSGNTAVILNTKVDTANNGLTKVGRNVRLGGSLSGSTNIGLGTFNLVFTGASGQLRYGSALGTVTPRTIIDQGYFTGNTLYTAAQILVYSSGTTDINVTTPVSIPLNRLIKNNTSFYTYTGGTALKILVAGTYDVSYSISVTNSNGTAHSVSATVYKNGTSVVETTTSVSIVGSTGAGASLSLPPTQITFAANDIVHLRGFRLIAGGGTVNLTPNTVFISIVKKY